MENSEEKKEPIVCQWCQTKIEGEPVKFLRYKFCSAGCEFDFKDHYDVPVNTKYCR